MKYVQIIKLPSKTENKVLRTVRETIAKYRMFSPGDSVLVAVSGGPDSIALMNILYTIAGEYALRLAVAHLNHDLRRQESERDAEFVAALAGNFVLPFYLEKKDVRTFQKRWHLSPEEAARQVRYGFYDAVASKYGFNKIALGHQGDDNAELILMNLLRGSGPLGLCGIPPVRDDKYVRPLIRLKRVEILDYISEKKLTYVTDSSNMDPALKRNQVRHHLIPELKRSYNPAIVDSLNRLGEIIQAEEQWIDDAIDPLFTDCVLDRASDCIRLALPGIDAMDPAVGRRFIRKAIFSVKGDLRRITFGHVDAVLEMTKKNQARGSLDLPGGIQVIKDAAALTVKREQAGSGSPVEIINYRHTINGPGTTLIKEANCLIKLVEIGTDDVPDFRDAGNAQAFFDRDCLRFPLVVRNFRAGDRFSPLGVKGTQKLKKYFSSHKIAPHQRKKCPILLSDDKIIWVAGHRIDNRVRLRPQTQRVLMAELLLA